MKRSLAVLAALATAVVVLYRKSYRLYWTYDDPWFLHVALVRRWTEGFTDAGIWRQNLFTPLLTATFELFAATLWIEPRRWYAAQLVLLVALAFAVYVALRLYVDVIPAAAGALLFLIGPPLVNAAAHLGVIHYLEALLFVTLAFIAFARKRDALSAVLYFVAILAKEIAVPLPALLFLSSWQLSVGSCQEDADPLPTANRQLPTAVRRVLPHAIALAVYTIWRLVVIGLPVAGYGWTVGAGDIARLPLGFATVFQPASVALIVIVAIIAATALRSKRAVLIALAGLFLSIAPIIPVAREMQPRFALLPWLWLCAGFALGVSRIRRNNIVIAAVLIVALFANRLEWAFQYTRSKRMSEEARVWVHEKGDILLRNPAIPPGTMPELEWLKEDYFPHAKGARWFYDDIFLCTHPIEGRRILEYNPKSRLVEEVKVSCTPGRTDVPLFAEFQLDGDALTWRFGPYENGTWRLILVEGEHAWDVPRESLYRVGFTKQLTLRIAYRSPEGWVTYSPPIALDFTRQSRTTWRR